MAISSPNEFDIPGFLNLKAVVIIQLQRNVDNELKDYEPFGLGRFAAFVRSYSAAARPRLYHVL